MWASCLITATPMFAVSTRRLHDTGRSGWLLAKSGALTAAQAAFWLGVQMSHGKDALAWAAALAAALAQLTISLILFYFYCQRSQNGANEYGKEAPKLPTWRDVLAR